MSSLPGSGMLRRSKERVITERTSPAELAAETSSEDARSFVRRVKRVTRRKFGLQQKVCILPDGFRGSVE